MLSFPVYAVVTPNDFIDSYINEGEYREIYKIDLLIFKNEFIEDVDLKEKWKTLEPLDLSQELFMIKDQPTLLIKNSVFKEKNQNNLISLNIENLIEEVTESEEEITKEKPIRVRFNLTLIGFSSVISSSLSVTSSIKFSIFKEIKLF